MIKYELADSEGIPLTLENANKTPTIYREKCKIHIGWSSGILPSKTEKISETLGFVEKNSGQFSMTLINFEEYSGPRSTNIFGNQGTHLQHFQFSNSSKYFFEQ